MNYKTLTFMFSILMFSPAWSDAPAESAISAQEAEYTANKTILDALDSRLLITYQAPEERHVVTIFTDVFCPYCRKLHQDMDEFLQNGITVQYVPFPLSMSSVKVLESIWCAKPEDRAVLLDIAMLQGKFLELKCDGSVINDAKSVASLLQVYGTPSIYLQNGRKVSGFMSPKEISDGLEGRLSFDEWVPKHLRQ